MNEIVKQHNDLLSATKPDFTPDMLNIFQAICVMAKEKGTQDVCIPYELLKDLANLSPNTSKNQMIDYIEKIQGKMVNMSTTLKGENGETKTFALFAFNNRPKDSMLIVNVHKWYMYMLNDLDLDYTYFELREYTKLKSTYAKGIYTMLKRYRTTGYWYVTVEELKRFLGVPKSYGAREITRRIVEPAVKELKEYYPTLSFSVERNKVKSENGEIKQGRPRITHYKFTFTREEKKEKPDVQSKPDPQYIAKLNGWTRIGRYCPVCHREVFSKLLENDNGLYPMIGHSDFKTGGCNWHTYDISKALMKEQLQDIEAEAVSNPNQEENKERLRETLAGMFTKEV